jgi:Fe-S-cluster-containing dehydrogenase component
MSCKEPACKNVCPTGAINIDDKGVVRTDYSKCTLCLKCVYSCPYGARVYWPDMGIVDSCDFCADRGYKPYCSEMCPGEAIHFGDFSDRGSKISEFLKGDLAKPIIIEGYDVRPKVYYIAPHKEDLEEAAKYLKSRMLEGKNNE